MVPPPYDTSHLHVGLWCFLIAVGSIFIIRRYFVRFSVLQVPRQLGSQVLADVQDGRPWSLYWWGLLTWGGLVSALHFIGLGSGLYAQFPWWDLMTHSMSGAGVGGIVLVGLRGAAPARPSLGWVLVVLLAIGTSFEVYEYVFKSFWHSWTVSVYARDTLVDLVMNWSGGVLSLLCYRTRSAVSVDSSKQVRHSHGDD
ncbi:hypothetical protein CK500_05340 [Halorubrum salipaludis]|uniref:Uncharacterized protein n=1 Tax=Halorubrum salipaludis TaxID=2032630 RepID=A0A2A2FK41_9EURY|nr:hypothetical protein [Halorubrum salipaludis]PAU84933.1 hypothetical protein CK500_05340 [Halorubrum salipaludis]